MQFGKLCVAPSPVHQPDEVVQLQFVALFLSVVLIWAVLSSGTEQPKGFQQRLQDK